VNNQQLVIVAGAKIVLGRGDKVEPFPVGTLMARALETSHEEALERRHAIRSLSLLSRHHEPQQTVILASNVRSTEPNE
jgi:hypothetical protein